MPARAMSSGLIVNCRRARLGSLIATDPVRPRARTRPKHASASVEQMVSVRNAATARSGSAHGRVIAAVRVSDHRARPLLWAAFILTRPLGATVGDFLDKPVAKAAIPHEIAARFDDGSEPPVVLEGVRGGHADQPASCVPGGCESV